MKDKCVKLLATFFYLGDFPVAPGSLASLAGTFLYILTFDNFVGYIALTIIVTVLGFAVSGRMETILKQKDPSCVVIDEVAGVLIAFFLLPLTPAIVITTFFLFRAFDMFKIYPVNKFEQMKGSVGIMTDDLFAGFYTNITMHIAIQLVQIFK